MLHFWILTNHKNYNHAKNILTFIDKLAHMKLTISKQDCAITEAQFVN